MISNSQGSNVRILELKKAYRDNVVPQSPQSKENKPRNEGTRPGYKDQLQPMREAQQLAQQSAQKDPLQPQRSPRDLEREQSREQLRREQSRERLRRDQSRDQLQQKRDRSKDRAHRDYSKDGPREFQRDPQRQLQRDQSREFVKDSRRDQREPDRGVARAQSRSQLSHEPSPRSTTRRTAQERRSPAPQRQSQHHTGQTPAEVDHSQVGC